jgi:hypothetical protein
MAYRINNATNIYSPREIGQTGSLANAEAAIAALFPALSIVSFDIDAENDAADALLSNGTIVTVEPDAQN